MREILFDMLEINIGAAVVIFIFFIGANTLRKKYGAGWMKVIWLLVAVRLVIPYNFSLPFVSLQLFDRPTAGQEPARPSGIGENAGQEDKGQMGAPGADGQQTGTAEGSAAGMQLPMNGAAIQDKTGYGGGKEGETAYASPGDTGSVLLRNRESGDADILLMIWLTGAGGCLLYTMMGYLFFHIRCNKKMRPLKDSALKKQILAAQRRIIGKACIPVFQSCYVTSPMLLGIFRPGLVIPAAGKKWSGQTLELVMAHELCHYRMKDLPLKFFMTMVWCVNWFNPAVWILKKQFFYDVELACDEYVLKKSSDQEREVYARLILSMAGNSRDVPVFSTGFTEDKRKMAGRIDHIFDNRRRKKGIVSIFMAGVLILAAGVAVSCGYRPDEAQSDTGDGERVSVELPGTVHSSPEHTPKEENFAGDAGQAEQNHFDYNHAYNAIIRVYQNDVYIARQEGICRVKDGAGEEELIYENGYDMRRGMALYQNSLFFTGSVEGGEGAATIYRMNLDTLEVNDALAALDQKFQYLQNLSVYEDNLYAAEGGFGRRIGFALAPDGGITGRLDEDEDNFIFKENNAYIDLELQLTNTPYDSEEHRALADEQARLYQPVTDAAACRELLHGSCVVSRYKDEACREACLQHEDGTYEYLCDINDAYAMVTETGLYHVDGVSGNVLYVDFATKQSSVIYEQTQDWAQICMLTYDETYIYLGTNRSIGSGQDDQPIHEVCLERVPRQGGAGEKLYQFEENPNWRMPYSLFRRCGVYGSALYLDGYQTVYFDGN